MKQRSLHKKGIDYLNISLVFSFQYPSSQNDVVYKVIERVPEHALWLWLFKNILHDVIHQGYQIFSKFFRVFADIISWNRTNEWSRFVQKVRKLNLTKWFFFGLWVQYGRYLIKICYSFVNFQNHCCIFSLL